MTIQLPPSLMRPDAAALPWVDDDKSTLGIGGMDVAVALDLAFLLTRYSQFFIWTTTDADCLAGLRYLETETGKFSSIHQFTSEQGETIWQFSFDGRDQQPRMVRMRAESLETSALTAQSAIRHEVVMPAELCACSPLWLQFFSVGVVAEGLPFRGDASVYEIYTSLQKQ